MALDWYEAYVDENGEIDEDRSRAWMQEATELFLASPEAAELSEGQREILWLDLLQDYAYAYRGIPLARLGPDDLDELLLYVVPRKVSTEPDQGPVMVAQLRAFFSFGARQFGAREALALLPALGSELAAEVQRRLGDPKLFGVAKSFVMRGREHGFDMRSPEGTDAWILASSLAMAGESLEPAPPARNRKERREAAKSRKKLRR